MKYISNGNFLVSNFYLPVLNVVAAHRRLSMGSSVHCRRISVSLVWISCPISRISGVFFCVSRSHDNQFCYMPFNNNTEIHALYEFYPGTVTAKTHPSPSLNEALAILKNNVYRGKFWLEMFDETGLGAIEVQLFLTCFTKALACFQL